MEAGNRSAERGVISLVRSKFVASAVAFVALSMLSCDARSNRVASPTRPSSSPSATDEPQMPVKIAQELGSAPTNCPGPHPTQHHVSRAYARLIGARPLWAGFYARYEHRSHAFIARDTPRTKYGFRVKVLWVVTPGHDGPLTIAGRNIRSGAPIRFDAEEVTEHGTEARLDPATGGIGETGWREFPSYLYFDGAGCFKLSASWDEGGWSLKFGFGK